MITDKDLNAGSFDLRLTIFNEEFTFHLRFVQREAHAPHLSVLIVFRDQERVQNQRLLISALDLKSYRDILTSDNTQLSGNEVSGKLDTVFGNTLEKLGHLIYSIN